MKFAGIRVSRRRLLGIIACVAAAGNSVLAVSIEDEEDGAKRRLMALISDRQSAHAVGRSYLRKHPDECESDRLLALIRQAVALSDDEIAQSPKLRLRERFRSAFVRDFEHRRVTSVNGWTVSLTEARLCALISIAA